jgi:hypothetical protein
MAHSQTDSWLGVTPDLPRRAVIGLPLCALLFAAARRAASQTPLGVNGLPRLSYAGTELAPVTVDPAYVNIRIAVDLAGDRPLASYMAARPRGSPALQCTADGAWVPWDQQTQSLIANQFVTLHGNLVFVIAGANFSALSFPVALELAYRMPAGVKFGVLTMTSTR